MLHLAITCDICGAPYAHTYEMRRLDQTYPDSHEIVFGLDMCGKCWETKLAYLRRYPTKGPEPQAKVVVYPNGFPGDSDAK